MYLTPKHSSLNLINKTRSKMVTITIWVGSYWIGIVKLKTDFYNLQNKVWLVDNEFWCPYNPNKICCFCCYTPVWCRLQLLQTTTMLAEVLLLRCSGPGVRVLYLQPPSTPANHLNHMKHPVNMWPGKSTQFIFIKPVQQSTSHLAYSRKSSLILILYHEH